MLTLSKSPFLYMLYPGRALLPDTVSVGSGKTEPPQPRIGRFSAGQHAQGDFAAASRLPDSCLRTLRRAGHSAFLSLQKEKHASEIL